MKKSCLIICLLHLATAITAQVKSFTVEADKNRIVIGEQFHLIIKTVYAAKQVETTFSIDSIPHFEILGKGKQDSIEEGDELAVEQRLDVTSWDSGDWTIPSFLWGGKTSKPLKITVSFSAFNPSQDYHDIKDILEVKKPARTTWYWWLLGALLLIVLVVLLFPSNKKPEAEKAPPPKISYSGKDALHALAKLEKEYKTLSSKIFYTELVDLLRSYLRLKIKSDPFTTATELLGKKITEMETASKTKNDVIDVLLQADLAKFAKHEAGDKEKLKAVQSVRKLIQSTDNSQ